ncbi:hypothetical protein [Christiangramia sabulilitoris]|uniref:Uncharacterized protein n=1 Tax=Christiangramia sabulilitoris TaxID=2583991 RepID=A0A550HZT0_9FLAO|nr:hypothetical protein [Christiangramia sabulilitoris]TRO64234.1 hypothetical protein FGM01_12100 [Christiangramia sabulilitoris]
MKNQFNQIFKSAVALTLFFAILSCSNDPLVETDTLETYDFKLEKAESWEDQIEILTKAMRRFHNFEVAIAQGYVPVSPLVSGMGIHYAKFDYVDMQFDLLKPEILVYHPDENGDMQFVAAEYLYVIPDCFNLSEYPDAPEGFLGGQDEWSVNCYAGPGGWTLHAWVGLENPDGVFAAYNPVLLEED